MIVKRIRILRVIIIIIFIIFAIIECRIWIRGSERTINHMSVYVIVVSLITEMLIVLSNQNWEENYQ